MAFKYLYSRVRMESVEVSRLYSEDGFLYLTGDPEIWIQSNPADRLSSVRCLELNLWGIKGEAIGDSIGELSELTHLCIEGGLFLKFLPNTISRLHKLQQLELCYCDYLEELPANLGDLQSLSSVSLHVCLSLKFLPDSVAKLSKLTSLSFSDCIELKELPANLGDLQSLTYLGLSGCECLKSLPWSISKLSKLRSLTLPVGFRLYTLPSHWDDSLLISVQWTHIRKSWKALKSEMELLSLPFPLIPVDAAPFPLTTGYLHLMGNPALWIERNYNLLSSVRLLDLDLEDDRIEGNVPLSLEKLPELTHLYISYGFCDFERDIEFLSDSLGKLSKLVSLHLTSYDGDKFPASMYLPVSLRYLSLSSYGWEPECLPDSYMSIIANLSNLKTLDLCCLDDLDLLPLNLNLTKLILRSSRIKSLPIGLQHLEIMHFKDNCDPEWCVDLSECLNQLVNLETLSYTCYETKFLPSITSLPNLQELHLKDCFNLKGLSSNLDGLVKLGTLNVSGTRVKSLPNSIMKLHNLRYLILPKCFMLESLPQCFGKEVMISIDETSEQYYLNQGYYHPWSNKVDRITSGTMEGVNEVVVKESTIENIIEKQVQHRPLNHLPDAIQISEGSYFPGRTDPISNDSHHASSDVQNHEMNILPTGNTIQVHAPIELEVGENSPLTLSSSRDCVATSVHNIAAESSSISHETSLFGENSQEGFQNEQMDITNMEMQQGIAPCNSIISDHGGSNYHASKNEQDKNPQSGKVKNKTQKIEITRETIELLLSQDIRLVDAAEQLGVSRSTMKRALKDYGITWPSNRKRKLQDPFNPANHGHEAEHLDGANWLTLSDHVPSEFNDVKESTPDAVIRTVEESPMSTQCHMDGHQHVGEYSNGVKECALWNPVQPNGSPSTFVVKAAYKKDTVRFNFSSSSSIEKLREEVGKSLELEVGKFKIKYQDDDKEWMLMNRMSDLEHALSLSRSSGNNVVRLSIELKK